jgi:hypothetical protein
MPDLIHTGTETIYTPGLPAWQPGEVRSVGEEHVASLLTLPGVEVVTAAHVAEEVPPPAPPTNDSALSAQKASE